MTPGSPSAETSHQSVFRRQLRPSVKPPDQHGTVTVELSARRWGRSSRFGGEVRGTQSPIRLRDWEQRRVELRECRIHSRVLLMAG